jgi:hypothetical protein
MALDNIKGLALGLNAFIKPKDSDDASTGKTRGVGYEHAQTVGKKLGLNKEKTEGKQADGLSFLKAGALGDEDAVYVKGGRAGALHNIIA